MAFEKSYDETPLTTLPPCIHLRSKSIYVSGADNPEKLGQSPSGHCWCNVTQHVLGPDRGYVTRQECIAGRECFKETY